MAAWCAHHPFRWFALRKAFIRRRLLKGRDANAQPPFLKHALFRHPLLHPLCQGNVDPIQINRSFVIGWGVFPSKSGEHSYHISPETDTFQPFCFRPTPTHPVPTNCRVRPRFRPNVAGSGSNRCLEATYIADEDDAERVLSLKDWDRPGPWLMSIDRMCGSIFVLRAFGGRRPRYEFLFFFLFLCFLFWVASPAIRWLLLCFLGRFSW